MESTDAPRLSAEHLLGTFSSYGQPRERWLVGGEFERAVVRSDGSPVGYHEPHGIRWILETLAEQDDWEVVREGEYPIALLARGANTTLEPGGQVELSGAPHARLADLAAELKRNRNALLSLSEGRDLHWITTGLTPIAPIESIGWVPKGRYAVMGEYLPRQGDLALFMMKGTCSVQCNYDFADEADCAAKVRLCSGLAPLTTALFANSPLYKNQDTGFKSYRGHVWTRTDPARTGFPPALREAYTHRRWVEWLLDVPMMFYKRDADWRPAEGRSFRQWLEQGIDGRFPTEADWDLHQTSVFPEVRIKRTIEVRGADCVDHELAIAFCALFTGLMYCEGAQAAALELVAEIEAHGTHDARFDAACRGGLQGRVGNRSLWDFARELGQIASTGLGNCLPEDVHLIDPLLARIASGRSPADDLLEAWRRDPSPASVVRAVAY